MRREGFAARRGVLAAGAVASLALLLAGGPGLRADQPKDKGAAADKADQSKDKGTPRADRKQRLKDLQADVDRARQDMEKAQAEMQKAMRAYAREMRRLAQERPFPRLPGQPFPGGPFGGDGPNVQGGVRLGILPTTPGPTLREQLGLAEGKGVVVARVLPDSPAAKAGLKEHDVLLKVDGKDVPSSGDELRAILAGLKGDKAVDLTILRRGKRETLKGVKLSDGAGPRPKGPRPRPKVQPDQEGRPGGARPGPAARVEPTPAPAGADRLAVPRGRE